MPRRRGLRSEPPSVIRCVLFDAAGTLIHVAEPIGVTYARIAAAHGVTVSPEAIERAFRGAFSTAPALAFPGVPEESLADHELAWWRAVVENAFSACGVARGPRLERAFGEMFAHFASPRAWRAYHDVVPTLDRLRADGIRLAVVSNFDGRLDPVLAGLDLSRRFDAIIASSRQGAAKPAAAIFHAALRACGEEPFAALHVGDSLALDVEGARLAGLAALRIDRNGVADADTLVTLLDLPSRLRAMR